MSNFLARIPAMAFSLSSYLVRPTSQITDPAPRASNCKLRRPREVRCICFVRRQNHTDPPPEIERHLPTECGQPSSKLGIVLETYEAAGCLHQSSMVCPQCPQATSVRGPTDCKTR